MKCKYCGKEIDSKTCFVKLVPYRHRDGSDGVHKFHYCNEHEAEIDIAEKEKKKIIHDEILDTLDRICHGVNFSLLIKRLNAVRLLDANTEEKLYYYLHDLNNEIEITEIMNRSFVNEYAKLGYLASVLSNKLSTFTYDSSSNNTDIVEHKSEVIKEPVHATVTRRKTISDMEALLDD